MSIIRCDGCNSPWDSDWQEHCPRCGPPNGYDAFDYDAAGILELQRVDEAGYYGNDDEAWKDFIVDLGQGDARAIQLAMKLLENWRDPMAVVCRKIEVYDGVHDELRRWKDQEVLKNIELFENDPRRKWP